MSGQKQSISDDLLYLLSLIANIMRYSHYVTIQTSNEMRVFALMNVVSLGTEGPPAGEKLHTEQENPTDQVRKSLMYLHEDAPSVSRRV